MIKGPNSVIIDLPAVVYNLRQVKELIDQGTKIMGIVKSDAYGHGLLAVSQTLERNNIDCLGVAHLSEAIELRKSGIKAPIVILCGIRTRDEALEVVEKGLTPVLFDRTAAEILAQESTRRGKETRSHLKVDTGMGRLGIPHMDIRPFIQSLTPLKGLVLEALSSHLSSADERKSDFTEIQIQNFEKAVNLGRSMGLDLPFNNLANSAGIMAHKKAHFEMVRPGIMLYGGLPAPEFVSPVPLKPAMHFKGQILQIKDVPHNTPISYGRTYHTKGPRRIAVISTGYGDGLPRSISNLADVLIKEQKVSILGTICMNLTVCDITEVEEAEVGDEVVFLGSQGRKTITGDDLAKWAGTISYEVLCSIGQRNKKEYRS